MLSRTVTCCSAAQIMPLSKVLEWMVEATAWSMSQVSSKMTLQLPGPTPMAGVPEERIVCEPDEFRAAELLHYTPGDDVYILYGTDSLALSYKVYDHMKEEAARHAQDGAEKEAQA